MELRQLEYFQEVCRTGNFTRAAANLYVAQPVITTAIRKLETELGVLLLNRTNKAVILTAEGQVFLERVNSLLGLAKDISQEMHDYNKLKRGLLKLGVPPQIASIWLPGLFSKFNEHYPNFDLSITEEGSAATINLIEKEELNVGIVILPDCLPNLKTHLLFRQPIVLCVSKEHRFNARTQIEFSELENEKFILRKKGSFQRDIVFDLCRKHNISPNVIFSSSQIQTIRALVAKNIGITFFMEAVIKDDADIVPIPLSDPVFVNIGLAWKAGKYLPKASQAFIDFVIENAMSST